MRHKAIVRCSWGAWNAKLTLCWVQPRYSEWALLPNYCGPFGSRTRRRYWTPCQKRQCCFLLIHSWMALDRATFFVFFFFYFPPPPVPLPPPLPPQCHLCYIIQRESCASERTLIVGEYISHGGMEVLSPGWSQPANQPTNQPTNQIVTLSMYDFVLFYPSNECMSTECPVTSLL